MFTIKYKTYIRVGNFEIKERRKNKKQLKFRNRTTKRENAVEKQTQSTARWLGAHRADTRRARVEDARGRDGAARRQTQDRGALAHIQDSPPEIALYLRSLLQTQSDLARTLRLLHQREDRRRQSHRQVEKARLREFVLFAVYSNARHQLWHQLCVSCAQEQAGRGQSGRVRALRMSWLLRIDTATLTTLSSFPTFKRTKRSFPRNSLFLNSQLLG